MALRRFYAPRIEGQALALDADQSAHARKTLRLGTGDSLEVFDGAGTVARCQITDTGPTLCLTVRQRWTESSPRPRLDLAVPAPKGARADTLVEMATQLGVDRLIWLQTARGVVEPSEGKQQRFQRLAIEAAKQCRRAHLMRIDPVDEGQWHRVLADAEPDLRLIAAAPCDEASATDADRAASGLQSLQAAGNSVSDADTLHELRSARQVRVLIGPEGGWTEAEMREALAHGFHPWRFGPHVLRVETAALAAASIIRAAADAQSDPLT